MRYIMLLQIKENLESSIEHKAVLLPECNDTDNTYLYKVLSFFSLKNWVNLCGVIPSFDCGCLSEDDVNFWKSHLIEYNEIIEE